MHPAALALNEIETAGVCTDYDKLLAMIRLYIDKKTKMQAEFERSWGINWPEFNFRSVDHVRVPLREQPEGTIAPRGRRPWVPRRLKPRKAAENGIPHHGTRLPPAMCLCLQMVKPC